jgi:RNA-binding protein YlmH
MKRNDSDLELLVSRAQDMAEMALKKGEARFSPFLSDAEEAFLKRNLRYNHDDEKLIFFGGYDDADYKCAGFFPSYYFYDENFDANGEFPICAVFAKGSGFRKLTHRDFLGSMMSLGLKRETIGDIVVSEDGFSAYVFCLEKTAEYLAVNFTSAANDKITCSLCDVRNVVIPERKFEIINTTVNSPRIDAVVCACLDVSREDADKLIRAGFVATDHMTCEDKSKLCAEGTLISIRHHGRFMLYKFGDRNRRDRLRITIRRYI